MIVIQFLVDDQPVPGIPLYCLVCKGSSRTLGDTTAREQQNAELIMRAVKEAYEREAPTHMGFDSMQSKLTIAETPHGR